MQPKSNNPSNMCISMSRVCVGYDQCPEGDNETECGMQPNSNNPSNMCICKSRVCDDNDECREGDDVTECEY